MSQLSGWGLAAAIPSTGWSEHGRAAVHAQAWSLVERTRARLQAVDALEQSFAEQDASSPPTPTRRVDRARQIVARLFGRDFPLLPEVVVADGPATAGLFSASATLTGGDAAIATGWLRKLAKVRPGVAQLDDVLTLSELLRDSAGLTPTIGQLPAQDTWVAVSAPDDRTRGSLSLCTFDHGALAALSAGSAIAGLVIDTWTERIPDPEQLTGVALHFDAPSSRPPQSLLLLVPPEGEPWDFTLVVDSLLETLEAAQLRAVDPDVLSGYGHQFPAIYPPAKLNAGPQE